MVQKMDRSVSKFLYEFLPENTLNHANLQVSGQIRKVGDLYENGEKVELDAPDSYVIRRVKQQFYRWPNSENLLTDDLYANVDIRVPGSAKYHMYPRTFECPNSNCGMFIKFTQTDERDFYEKDPDELFTCDNCQASLSVADQLPFVAICECGEMTELWAPTHKHNGSELNMKLSRPTTRMSSWEWKCVHPECDHSLSFMATKVGCPDPDCPNDDLRITNHTDSEVFYPQTENFINLQQDLQRVDDNTRYRAKVISDYVLSDEMKKPSEKEIKKKAAEFLGGAEAFLEASEEKEQRARQQAYEALTADRQEHQKKVAAWLESHDEYSDQQKIELAEECYEYLSLTQDQDYAPGDDFRGVSFEGMSTSLGDVHLDETTINHYQDERDSLNIDRIHLLEDIPITTVTYGFTRVNSEAEETIGPPIDHPDIGQETDQSTAEDTESEKGEEEKANDADEEGDESSDEEVEVQLNTFITRKDPYPTFFARENKAEGILIELDPELVLDWLETNNVITSEDRPDPDQARMWFVDAVRNPDRYTSLSDPENHTHLMQSHGQAISRQVYTLLNSYAHAFINTIGVLSGLQRESLVERIMPHTLSFLIYKRPDTDQAFGTILSLFEERFEEFSAQFEEQETCPLNRVCFHDENGACENCLYLPVMSTQNTNHNLSRSVIFGGQFDGGKFNSSDESITGFHEL